MKLGADALGIVRAVPSGDTIVLLKGSGSEEVQLTLLGLKAPLLGKKTKDEATKDEVCKLNFLI